MKTIDIVAYKRSKSKKSDTASLRKQGLVPSVIYGNNTHLACAVPLILFRPLLYTKDICFINLDLEGQIFHCVLQDAQHHPVSDMVIHADFKILDEKKAIVLGIPLATKGAAPGLMQGGKMEIHMHTLRVKALPKHMPSVIEVDVSSLQLGKNIKVKDILAKQGDKPYEIKENIQVPVLSVQVPRAAKEALAEEQSAETSETETTKEDDNKATETIKEDK